MLRGSLKPYACPLFFLPLLFIYSPAQLAAQNEPPVYFERIEDIPRMTNTAYLVDWSHQDSLRASAERDSAIRVARRYGYPVDGLFEGTRYSLQGFDATGQMQYNASSNAISAQVINTNEIHPGGDAGLSLTGSGKTLCLWEIGRPRITHVEIAGRTTLADFSSQSIDNHANHVAGTLIAAGINPLAKGMAYEANLRVFDAALDASEMATEGAAGRRLSNHSYGDFAGWVYGDFSGEDGWHWWGSTSVSQTIDLKFGQYEARARSWDNVAFNAPFFLPVKAAGNNRGLGPNPGVQHWVRNASNQWISSLTTRERNGGTSGYDCLPTYANAKNILTVGSLRHTSLGNLFVFFLANSSSWGPTDDGRIKPDVVALGVNIFSAFSEDNNSYGNFSGTSMASPAVAGSAQLLLQHYENLNPGFSIRSSALKALIIHTADQLDNEVGPNYRAGWGLMNTRAAADLITESFDPDGRHRLRSIDTVFNNGTREFTYFHDGQSPFKVTIVWTDPPGNIQGNTLNSTTARLVNDLDLRLIRMSDNATFFPWTLNPASPAAEATKSDNFRDNVEQIYEENLPAGYYTIRVSHKGSLSGGRQLFSTIVSGRANDIIAVPTCSGHTLLTACSGNITDGSDPEAVYTNNLDCSWLIAPVDATSVTLNFDTFDTEDDLDFVRVYNGIDATAPLLGEFSGDNLPPSLTANSGKIFLVFQTNGSVASTGWSANYSCSTSILGVSSTEYFFGSDTASDTLIITANCDWSIQDVPQWVTLNLMSGDTTTTITISCAANNSPEALTATITVTGCDGLSQTVTITQLGCSLPATPTITADGATDLCMGQSVALTATDSCPGCTVQWSNGQTGESITVSTAGTYTATYSDACGESPISNTIMVTTGTDPDTPVITADGTTDLCPGQSVTLTATNTCPDCIVQWSNGQTGVSVTVSTAGAYTATYTNACGESPMSFEIVVTVNNTFIPVIQISNLCDLAAPTGSNYQWYLDGAPIPGATEQFLSAEVNGQYVVSMANQNGCPGESEPVLLEECTTATTEAGMQSSIKLYPNPALGQVSLDILSPTSFTNVRLDLYAYDGRFAGQLYKGDLLVSGTTKVIHLPDLPAGMYIYWLISDQGIVRGPLVIQR